MFSFSGRQTQRLNQSGLSQFTSSPSSTSSFLTPCSCVPQRTYTHTFSGCHHCLCRGSARSLSRRPLLPLSWAQFQSRLQSRRRPPDRPTFRLWLRASGGKNRFFFSHPGLVAWVVIHFMTVDLLYRVSSLVKTLLWPLPPLAAVFWTHSHSCVSNLLCSSNYFPDKRWSAMICFFFSPTTTLASCLLPQSKGRGHKGGING